MKCPYVDCQKDYNDEWSKKFDEFINPNDFGHSQIERRKHSRVYIITRKCGFCNRYFHEIFVGHETERENSLKSLISYPLSKTKFKAKGIPQKAIDAFNEAERCRSVGSLTGTGGCLRKVIYAVCDDKDVDGKDYREKINNLPVKDTYKELLKQIKWLGDTTTKPGKEKYTMKMADDAFEILSILIDDLYLKDEKMEEVAKLLAKTRSDKD